MAFGTTSRPARGAWIEMVVREVTERAEKSRAPHGARGLKLCLFPLTALPCWSRPARGAWIEIGSFAAGPVVTWSRPARGAWIEIENEDSLLSEADLSRPARGAWIEIEGPLPLKVCASVAPRTGRVD